MLCQGEASEVRWGEARLINKNENAACLDSCSAILLAVLPDPISSLPRTRTGPSKTQGRQPERDNDNVYMLITCENMQQTADSQTRQLRRGSLQFAMRYTFSHQLKLPEQGGGAEDESTETEPEPEAGTGMTYCCVCPSKCTCPRVCRRLCRVCVRAY